MCMGGGSCTETIGAAVAWNKRRDTALNPALWLQLLLLLLLLLRRCRCQWLLQRLLRLQCSL